MASCYIYQEEPRPARTGPSSLTPNNNLAPLWLDNAGTHKTDVRRAWWSKHRLLLAFITVQYKIQPSVIQEI